MKLNRWEKLKTDNNMREIRYRNMLSYKNVVDSSHTVVCFPEVFLKNLQTLTTNLTIYDVYYRMRKSRSFEYESLHIYMRVDGKVIKAKFTLHTENDVFQTAFAYVINAEENEEARIFLMHVFRLMQAFVEENSPKRLMYLSSPVKEDFPDWIVEMERTI